MVGKNRDANGCYTFQIRCKNLKTGKENYVVKSFKAVGIKEIELVLITLYLENLILRIDPPDSKRYTSLCSIGVRPHEIPLCKKGDPVRNRHSVTCSFLILPSMLPARSEKS